MKTKNTFLHLLRWSALLASIAPGDSTRAETRQDLQAAAGEPAIAWHQSAGAEEAWRVVSDPVFDGSSAVEARGQSVMHLSVTGPDQLVFRVRSSEKGWFHVPSPFGNIAIPRGGALLTAAAEGAVIKTMRGPLADGWTHVVVQVPSGVGVVTLSYGRAGVTGDPSDEAPLWLDGFRLASGEAPLLLAPRDFDLRCFVPHEMAIPHSGRAPVRVDLQGELPLGLHYDPERTVIVGTPSVAGTFTIPVTVSNAHGKDEGVITLTITESLGAALDVPEDYDVSSPSPWPEDAVTSWDIDRSVYRTGGASVRSSATPHGHRALVETSIDGPTRVEFSWKVSSQAGHDWATVAMDDIPLQRISGEIRWQSAGIDVPAGQHRISWSYQKDAEGSSGEDAAWVDEVVLIGPAFEGWMASWVRPGAAVDPGLLAGAADPDSDGKPNLVEYAAGSDPFDPLDANIGLMCPLPIRPTEKSFYFTRNPLARGVRLWPEWSPDLSPGSWRRDVLKPPIECGTGAGLVGVWMDTVVAGSDPQGFWRLRAEATNP